MDSPDPSPYSTDSAAAFRVEDHATDIDAGVKRESDEPVRPDRGFLAWGVGSYAAVTTALVAASLATSDGKLIYLIDDPAIHLSLARTLAEAGTWGVVPGDFQSASSAPVWTLLLSLVHLVVPFGSSVAPLLFNAASAIGLVVVLAKTQTLLRPSRRRRLDGPAVALLVVLVLFLPALTMLGMEHVLHMLLVVTIVALWTGALSGSARLRILNGTPLAAALLALSTFVRFETAFVAVGLALAALVPATAEAPRWPSKQQLRRAALALGSSAISLALFGAFNRAMGQGWLPNSVLAKGQVVSGASDRSIAPLAILNRLTADPVVAVLVTAALVTAIVGWRKHRFVGPCVVVVVTALLHASFASIGWFDRYQAYLIALGAYAMLQVGGELSSSGRWTESGRWVSRGSLVVLAAVLLVAPKLSYTAKVTNGVADTYLQRYQAALFLERYYQQEPIATGELGYISLLHDGPITDLFGLADFEVLELRREHEHRVPKAEWSALAAERGFGVVAVYPFTLWEDTPDEWIHVGEWILEQPTVTAFQPVFQFWATTPDEVRPLREHLIEFEAEMPEGVRLELNELATYRADMLSDG